MHIQPKMAHQMDALRQNIIALYSFSLSGVYLLAYMLRAVLMT